MTKQDLVIDYLYKLFKDKKVTEGDLIPSENSLMIKLNLSRNTVRSALRKLVESSILIPIMGKGYIYNNAKSMELKSYSNKYVGEYSSLFIKERYINKYEPDLKVHGYVEIIKVRYKNNEPFILTYQRISKETRNILKGDYKKSLYSSFEKTGIKVLFARKSIEYVDTPKEVKYFMSRSTNESILLKSKTTIKNNIIIESSHNYYYPKEFEWEWIEKNFK